MVASRNNEFSQISIFINENKLMQRDQLNYLSTLISRDRSNNTKIASRIVQVIRISIGKMGTNK